MIRQQMSLVFRGGLELIYWFLHFTMAQHVRFFARTVLVKNNDVDAAYRALDRSSADR